MGLSVYEPRTRWILYAIVLVITLTPALIHLYRRQWVGLGYIAFGAIVLALLYRQFQLDDVRLAEVAAFVAKPDVKAIDQSGVESRFPSSVLARDYLSKAGSLKRAYQIAEGRILALAGVDGSIESREDWYFYLPFESVGTSIGKGTLTGHKKTDGFVRTILFIPGRWAGRAIGVVSAAVLVGEEKPWFADRFGFHEITNHKDKMNFYSDGPLAIEPSRRDRLLDLGLKLAPLNYNQRPPIFEIVPEGLLIIGSFPNGRFLDAVSKVESDL
jgi:tetrahydromethanopterin S-methyltransferase subunit F